MKRKDSSPMAPPPFMVSAPGKVILFGEHAAVYGEPAIAAAISLRSYLFVTTLSKSKRTVRLNFKDIGLNHTWSISALPWDNFQQPSKKQSYHSTDGLDDDLLAAILPHTQAVSIGLSEIQREIHIKSATAFLYLFLSLGSRDGPGFVYTLRSTIPVGAGLGSSASVCVCLSAAMLLQTYSLSGPHPHQPSKEASIQVECINQWAFVGEMCIHGNPSGVDNTVATRGAATIFQRNEGGPPSVTSLTTFPRLPLLLIDTKQPRSTFTELQKVFNLQRAYPDLVKIILGSIGQITSSAFHIISRSNSTENHSTYIMKAIGPLMTVNQGLLVALGVSHPRLDRIGQLVEETETGWTKLTGAGGGGCAITLLKPDANVGGVVNLKQRLRVEGFHLNDIVLGADGVGVLWPAVFHTDDGLVEDVHYQQFESAVDAQEIEELVGVDVSARHGWCFWKN